MELFEAFVVQSVLLENPLLLQLRLCYSVVNAPLCVSPIDNDFLRKIDDLNKTQTIPSNAILITWDVKSLYTNIPPKEGLDALQKTLENENVPEKKIDTILHIYFLVSWRSKICSRFGDVVLTWSND